MAKRSASLRESSCPSRFTAIPQSAVHVPQPNSAFTLIELLTVIAIIAIFSGIVVVALRGGDKSQARDATVSTLSSLIASARSIAALKGVNAALLINNDTANTERYRRYVVVCTANAASGLWEPVDAGVTLPVGVFVLTNADPLPTTGPGLHKNSTDNWTRPSGGELRSVALSSSVTQAVNSATSESWSFVAFTPRGTLATFPAGDIVIANGRPLSGAAPASVLLEHPENVGGISISSYGSVTILRHSEDF
ncbi:MAG TPA: prepilin-type N-terminal cleavage/methylation domain-containing protein [Opitutaceae bacterium]|nr:prepilin-type N-terminal cleavage/methylation domain-containing protein [Opitutaceae bacterium]